MGIIVNGTTGQVLTATTGSSPTFQNVSSSGAVITLTGNSGGAISPTAGNINTLGTGSITIAGAGSTLTTQLTGITNHALQVGAGTATLTQLANGTSGQILTAVTGADPVWAAPASTFTPNSVINIVEDFIGTGPPGGNTSAYGQLNWFANVAWTVDATIGDSGHNGVIASAALAAGNQDIFLNGQSPVNAIAPQMILGGGAIQLNFVIKVATLSTGTNTYTLRVGFGVTANADQVNGVYFEYTNGVNSGNWQFKTANASTRTTSNSAIAVGTSYVNLGITINAAGTSCAFTANGVSLGTAIATNIPTVAITPFIDIVRSAGTVPAAAILFDLMYFTQTLTTPR
jgi:hypothetical protein